MVHYVNPDLFQRLEEDGTPVIFLSNTNYQDRLYGFTRAMEASGLTFSRAYHIYTELHDYRSLKQQLNNLSSPAEPPTAMFIHDDYFAAVVIGFLDNMGIRVPRDLSIICPGDV